MAEDIVHRVAIADEGECSGSPPAEGSQSTDYCPVRAAILVLQEKWTLHIVRALLEGPMGFNELGRAVGGCNPATLKLRLDHLAELGLLVRTVHSHMPPRTSYELAPAGVDLQRVIMAIDGWGREHLASGPATPAVAGAAAARS
jgi:DNA-binding HxlR family transcriptional regulator